MHAPSPLRSIPQSSGDESFSSSDGMPEMSEIGRKGEEDEEEQERETVLGEGRSGSSATRRSGEPARRRTARAARGEEDDDKMDTEE